MKKQRTREEIEEDLTKIRDANEAWDFEIGKNGRISNELLLDIRDLLQAKNTDL